MFKQFLINSLFHKLDTVLVWLGDPFMNFWIRTQRAAVALACLRPPIPQATWPSISPKAYP